jgi:hypothetical protein
VAECGTYIGDRVESGETTAAGFGLGLGQATWSGIGVEALADALHDAEVVSEIMDGVERG